MSTPEPLNPNIPNARRRARKFTRQTPFHHPHLDPTLPPNDLHLVPAALFPGRKLNWELPRSAVTNLHVKLQLTNDLDGLQKEFHDKIPQINDVLGLWGDLKGARATTTGEAQLRARTPFAKDQALTSTEEGEGSIFNLVSKLDSPGRADVIYLTDAVQESGGPAEDSSVPSNLRTIEWLNFDGSWVHLEDEPKMGAFPSEQGCDFDEQSMRRNSTPSNLRIREWLDDEQCPDFSSETYNSKPNSDSGKVSRQIGPYETFWINHDPYGPQLALDSEEAEPSSSTLQ